MVQRKIQFITQSFKKGIHRGVDLRCVDMDSSNRATQPVIAPERIQVLRTSIESGVDKYGNPFIVYKGLDTGYVLKSIHVVPLYSVKPDVVKEAGALLGYPAIMGNSKALHEHFETWRGGVAIDPVIYFNLIGVKYERKKENI